MELADMYSEVYDILNILGEEYKEKIPTRVYAYIERERNKNKVNNFIVDKPIEEQNIGEDTLKFIAYLNMEYWVSSEEKERLLKKYNENDKKMEQELYAQYNPDDIFKETTKEEKVLKLSKNEMIIYNEGIFAKIKNWLKKLINFK